MAMAEEDPLYMMPSRTERPWFCPRTKQLSEGDCYIVFNQLNVDLVGHFSMTDGDMSVEDITTVLKKAGLSKRQREAFFEEMDCDKYKHHRVGQVSEDIIDFDEFQEIVAKSFVIELSFAERVFLTFDDPSSSFLAFLISGVMLLLIILRYDFCLPLVSQQ